MKLVPILMIWLIITGCQTMFRYPTAVSTNESPKGVSVNIPDALAAGVRVENPPGGYRSTDISIDHHFSTGASLELSKLNPNLKGELSKDLGPLIGKDVLNYGDDVEIVDVLLNRRTNQLEVVVNVGKVHPSLPPEIWKDYYGVVKGKLVLLQRKRGMHSPSILKNYSFD